MSKALRGRTVGADNIAVGSIYGQERTIAGDVPPAETVGGKDHISVGSGGVFPTTIIADNQQVGVTTMLIERRG